MRLFRMVESLSLGLAVSAVLVLASGCRKQPPTILGVSAGLTYPTLSKGQILKWEGPPNGQAYSVEWIDNMSPCKDGHGTIPSTNVSGIETVTCVVDKAPPVGKYYAYAIGSHEQKQSPAGLQPCPGCYFYPPPASGDDRAVKQSISSAFVNVSCGGDTADTGSISVAPPTDQLNGATTLGFSSSLAVQIKNIAFPDGSNITCSTSSCNFANAVGSSWTYTVTATGNGPPYCGQNSTSGSATGTITK